MEKLYNEALAAYNNSYSPYSNFKVGAAILTKSGQIFTGTNIENASFGLTICAERNAMFQAYAKGFRKGDFLSILVIGDTDEPISPCGACRQVMLELLGGDCKVILTNLKKDIKETTVKELLPYSFSEDSLNG